VTKFRQDSYIDQGVKARHNRPYAFRIFLGYPLKNLFLDNFKSGNPPSENIFERFKFSSGNLIVSNTRLVV